MSTLSNRVAFTSAVVGRCVRSATFLAVLLGAVLVGNTPAMATCSSIYADTRGLCDRGIFTLTQIVKTGGGFGCYAYIWVYSDGNFSTCTEEVDTGPNNLQITFHQGMADLWGVVNDGITVYAAYLGPTVSGVVSAGASIVGRRVQEMHQRIANDPPDPNYQTLYQYPVRNLTYNWGLSPAASDYLNQTMNKLARVADALTGLLTSTERAQGALDADDAAMEAAQWEAAQSFQLDYESFSNEAAQLVADLPEILSGEGVSDVGFDSLAFEAGLDELEQNGLPADIADLLVELTGDPAAVNQFIDYALSLRGSSTTESAFSALHALAGKLRVTACFNGRDDDGDGQGDFPADPGCFARTSISEKPQCQDGLNNDNQTGIDSDGGASLDLDPVDGLIDAQFNASTPAVGAADAQCVGTPWKNKEKAGGCGLGFELVLLTPLLARLARKRRVV